MSGGAPAAAAHHTAVVITGASRGFGRAVALEFRSGCLHQDAPHPPHLPSPLPPARAPLPLLPWPWPAAHLPHVL